MISTNIQILDFILYFIVGIILVLIFDVFKAFRKYKKVKDNIVVVQDIIYFLFCILVIISASIYFLKDSIRGYSFISLFLGMSLYIKYISKYVVKIIIKLFDILLNIIKFIILPVNVMYKCLKKVFNFTISACKKIKYMIFYFCKKLSKVVKKRRNMKVSKVKVILFMIILGYFVVTFGTQQKEIDKYNLQINQYNVQKEEANEIIESYSNRENISEEEYIELIAREKLGLVKPYEKVFIDISE